MAYKIAVHGRNGTFTLDTARVFGGSSPHDKVYVVLFAKKSGKNPPCWLYGPREDLALLLEDLAKQVRQGAQEI